jgi:hypothetical protein
VLNAEPQSLYWYNVYWTLLFTIFYLQFKTNKLHELVQTTVEHPNQPDTE